MLGWIALKPETASSWKVSWNVDPPALSVPLRAAPLDVATLPSAIKALPGAELAHPARTRAVTAAAPAAACRGRRSCIAGTPYAVNVLSGRDRRCHACRAQCRADRSPAAARGPDALRDPGGRGDHASGSLDQAGHLVGDDAHFAVGCG